MPCISAKHIRTSLAALCLLGTGMASAGIIDFSDPQFATTFGDRTELFRSDVIFDGVIFTAAADAIGGNGFRLNTIVGGQNFGRPGNSLESLSFSSSQDILFTRIVGTDRSDLPPTTSNPDLPFDLLVDGVIVESGFTFTAPGATWDFADILLAAGSELTISVLDDPLRGAVLGSLSFEIPEQEGTQVPVPATVGLFSLGLAGLGWTRRRRSMRLP